MHDQNHIKQVYMFIHNRLTQHVSGVIMPIVRRTDCIKPRVVLAWMCSLRLCGLCQSNTSTHTVRSARVPTPHNRSQHIQTNTRRGFIQSVLLTMGIMVPEICWVNLLWINIYTCVICCFFLLLCDFCKIFKFLGNYKIVEAISLSIFVRGYTQKCRNSLPG